MNEENLNTLKKILNINQYILKKGIQYIDDTFNHHKSDFKKIKSDFSDHDLRGLYRYYILEKYNKLEFQHANRVKDVCKITVKDNLGELIEISKPELGWVEFDYYYCLLRIDRTFYNPIVATNFVKWVNHLIDNNTLLARWKVENLIKISSLVEHGNKIIELFNNLKIEDYISGVSEINKDIIKLKVSVKLNEKLLEKEKIKNIRLEKKLFHLKPKNNQVESLAKYYIDVAITIEDLPSMDLLASLVLSKASWHKKLWDDIFLGMVLKIVIAKLKNKRIKKNNKDTYVSIQNFINERLDTIKELHTIKAGLTIKRKPDYNENISDEIQNEFNNLS